MSGARGGAHRVRVAALLGLLASVAGCEARDDGADAHVEDAPAHDAGRIDDAFVAPDGGPAIPELPLAMRCEITPPSLETARLVADGTRFRDALGREVWLRGANMGGRNKWAPFLPFELVRDEDFEGRATALVDQLAGWGLDVVRLPFSWEALEPERGRYDEAYLDRLARLMELAWARGMRVILDFHQDVYASPFCGDGFPLWTLGALAHGPPRHDCGLSWGTQYGDVESGVPAAFERFWTNADGIEDAFVAMWEHVVARFAAHPAIVAYELLNEPGWGEAGRVEMESRLLPELVERLAPRLAAIDGDALFVQGGAGLDAVEASTSMREPAVSGLVYGPHLYDAQTIVGGRYNRARPIGLRATRLHDVGVAWDVPIVFGEFNAAWDGRDASLFLRDLYDAYDALGASATIWEVSLTDEAWNGERLDLVTADGTERPQVDEVVRAYPRATAGRVERFLWLADRHVAILASSEGDAGAVSELFVPPRHVGNSPEIRLDRGCVAWEAASGRLWVRSEGAGFTLVVRPSP
ncbi:MAG: cellulase family glycosylhydrolase [Sandaracinaceae bacterium]|nr:cellulase family glycosylhydrolase [Sandaracinaceae bacterium]